jgi:hypothetical protein
MNSRQYSKLRHTARKLGITLPAHENTTNEKPSKKESTPKDRTKGKKRRKEVPRLLKTLSGGIAILSLCFSGLALQQFLADAPEITPLDFATRDPFIPVFNIHNPMYISMYDVQIATQPGPAEGGNVSDDPSFYITMRERLLATCARLSSAQSFEELASNNSLIHTLRFDEIGPKDDITFKSGLSVGGAWIHYTIALVYRYRVKLLGFIPLWRKEQCRMFEIQRDSEGKAHIVPYKTPSSPR